MEKRYGYGEGLYVAGENARYEISVQNVGLCIDKKKNSDYY